MKFLVIAILVAVLAVTSAGFIDITTTTTIKPQSDVTDLPSIDGKSLDFDAAVVTVASVTETPKAESIVSTPKPQSSLKVGESESSLVFGGGDLEVAEAKAPAAGAAGGDPNAAGGGANGAYPPWAFGWGVPYWCNPWHPYPY